MSEKAIRAIIKAVRASCAKDGGPGSGPHPGGGSVGIKQKFHDTHKMLAAKLKENTISESELDQLDRMNKFVLQNKDKLKAIK